MTKIRKTNIEILRIVAMMFIIFSHFYSHGGFEVVSFNENGLFLHSIQILGKIGVNIFILISGYFLISNNEISVKKLLLMWIEILFYSITIYLLVVVFSKESFSIRNMVKLFFPISSKQMWFVSSYFIMYIFHPFINILLKNLEKQKYEVLIIIMTTIWCIFPTILNKDFECNKLIWFFYIYSIGGYIKLFPNFIEHDKKNKYLYGAIACYILSIIAIAVFDIINKDYSVLFGLQKLPTLVISLLLFIYFVCIKLKNNMVINEVAKCTFGVYLIHDNPYLKEIIWIDIFKVNSFYESDIFILFAITISTTITVFIICTLIEYVRRMFEKKIIEGMILDGFKTSNKKLEI